jgi:hypothetical protein
VKDHVLGDGDTFNNFVPNVVGFAFIGIAEKHARVSLGFQFRSLFFRYVDIRVATENPHVSHRWSLSKPLFVRY